MNLNKFKVTTPTLFIEETELGRITILIVYIDDIILADNDLHGMEQIKKQLSTEFEITNV